MSAIKQTYKCEDCSFQFIVMVSSKEYYHNKRRIIKCCPLCDKDLEAVEYGGNLLSYFDDIQKNLLKSFDSFSIKIVDTADILKSFFLKMEETELINAEVIRDYVVQDVVEIMNTKPFLSHMGNLNLSYKLVDKFDFQEVTVDEVKTAKKIFKKNRKEYARMLEEREDGSS